MVSFKDYFLFYLIIILVFIFVFAPFYIMLNTYYQKEPSKLPGMMVQKFQQPYPCPGTTLCQISDCFNVKNSNDNWVTCQQYDYDGNYQIDINDLSVCSSRCQTDGNQNACCSSTLLCNPGLECQVCDESASSGYCSLLYSPSPQLTPNCSVCFKGVCDEICHPKKEDLTCLDCWQLKKLLK